MCTDNAMDSSNFKEAFSVLIFGEGARQSQGSWVPAMNMQKQKTAITDQNYSLKPSLNTLEWNTRCHQSNKNRA